MNKILFFITNLLVCIGVANAAVRDGTSVARNASDKNTSSQIRTSTVAKRTNTQRGTTLIPRTATTTRATPNQSRATAARTALNQSTVRSATTSRTGTPARGMTPIVARNASNSTAITMSSTRTGTEYEQCKNTYFSCMDQFCTLKNDDYRRCSCSDRVFELSSVRDVLQDAGEKLTVFTENLDVVGMTAAQAAAMRQESEGEAALTDDNSASKALLQAIMNSIRGEDSTVGGKYADLNSITIAFDTTNAFGMTDVGQAIAAYNGTALYNAVYPQCRNAVRADCNDASLQRAITAYLMAIEQDCNTVQTAIETTQKQMKSAVREGSAMLDLARVENRKKHNSSDITTCINEVESAILSEQVCGANYHKCLDNGEFIDISTGAPITGVENFYELERLLVFSDGIDAVDQQLAKNPTNRVFVQNFEKRVKKFAEPALNKCVEDADTVWSEYLNKAMLAIYYAQKDKVAEIKQGCFDYISACYANGDTAITAAMAALINEAGIVIQPDKVALNTQMCTEYVNSCNNMFSGNIIADYVNTRQETDTLSACRAVAKQCFDKYGGTNYENFYYPYSGLFKPNSEMAPSWFTLYEITYDENGNQVKQYKSECAKQLSKIAACSDPSMVEQAFGGFDSIYAIKANIEKDSDTYEQAYLTDAALTNGAETPMYIKYGLLKNDLIDYSDATYKNGTAVSGGSGKGYPIDQRYTRASGVATEVYNQILSILSTQCMNLQGRFVEIQFIREDLYQETNWCLANFGWDGSSYNSSISPFVKEYHIGNNEDMCPRDYGLSVDTSSWGACLCWENGGRRSKWGKSAKCVNALPVAPLRYDTALDAYGEPLKDANGNEIKVPVLANDAICNPPKAGDPEGTFSMKPPIATATGGEPATVGTETITLGNDTAIVITKKFDADSWCTQPLMSGRNQVCPFGGQITQSANNDFSNSYCKTSGDNGTVLIYLPEGVK